MRIQKTEIGNYIVRDELHFSVRDIITAANRILNEDNVNVGDWPVAVEDYETFWQVTFFLPVEELIAFS